jgi:hypothetical protein
LTSKRTVRWPVTGSSLELAYFTDRNTAWYRARLAVPLRVRTPVPALKLPVMPNCEVKLRTSWPAWKPPEMETLAP